MTVSAPLDVVVVGREEPIGVDEQIRDVLGGCPTVAADERVGRSVDAEEPTERVVGEQYISGAVLGEHTDRDVSPAASRASNSSIVAPVAEISVRCCPGTPL